MASQSDQVSKVSARRKRLFGVIPVPAMLLSAISWILYKVLVGSAVKRAYAIRRIPIDNFGSVINQFDPWFNYRAAEYLDKNGVQAFFQWFDYQSWYPLGRPVGTTIYPGLQFTAVALYRLFRELGPAYAMSLHDICCYIPCWFGALATCFTALLAYEASGSKTAAFISISLASVNKASLLRSMGGDFDNESVAVPVMIICFYFWVRSLRSGRSVLFAFLSALSYAYMAASWGGFVFLLNMVALHAGVLLLLDWHHGVFDPLLFRSYSIFFVLGTTLVTQVPIIGLTPFRSAEQLGALLVWLFMVVLRLSEFLRIRQGHPIRSRATFRLRVAALGLASLLVGTLAFFFLPPHHFMGLSIRVKSLFVHVAKTNNPMVNSVAEHGGVNFLRLRSELQGLEWGWLLGTFALLGANYLSTLDYFCVGAVSSRKRASSFVLLFSVVVFFFCTRMNRLVLLSGPIACIATGVLCGWIVDSCLRCVLVDAPPDLAPEAEKKAEAKEGTSVGPEARYSKALPAGQPSHGVMLLALVTLISLCFAGVKAFEVFCGVSLAAAESSSPRLVYRSATGHRISDYLDAYEWLRDNTPEDARVFAWWDYGYDITGIANRTTLADGNTWNHEHIATIGKLMVSPASYSHKFIVQLAEYVFVVRHDIDKSYHMMRIAGSVYPELCKRDPLCRNFIASAEPLPLVTQLVEHKRSTAFDKMFEEVYHSKHQLVRIYKVKGVDQSTKAWVSDPRNRRCVAPGSWECTGLYPPTPEMDELLNEVTKLYYRV